MDFLPDMLVFDSEGSMLSQDSGTLGWNVRAGSSQANNAPILTALSIRGGTISSNLKAANKENQKSEFSKVKVKSSKNLAYVC